MIIVKAKDYSYRLILKSDNCAKYFPLFRSDEGSEDMWLVSPQHGRSFVVDYNGDYFVVSKGNGLSYTTHQIAVTPEQNENVLGLLLEKDALRDFKLGNEIAELGVRTNRMEAVIELDMPIDVSTERTVNPVLLQYSVECPYRISDAMFMDCEQIYAQIQKWSRLTDFKSKYYHEIAAALLFYELSTLHSHEILHNALTSQNITWALELLDFELSSSPAHPYDNEEYRRQIPNLFGREVWHIYQIILDIAGVLREPVNHHTLEKILITNSLSLT